MRFVITFAAAALVAAVVFPHYAAQISENIPATRTPQARVAQPVDSAAALMGSVTAPPDALGRFRVAGNIDGRRIDFMIDTGASVVALTEDDAANLGIHPRERDNTVLLKTANGTVRGAPVRLDMIEVGDVMVRDVAAVVLPSGALSDNLLGLTFLSRLRHYEYSGGRMILEQ